MKENKHQRRREREVTRSNISNDNMLRKKYKGLLLCDHLDHIFISHVSLFYSFTRRYLVTLPPCLACFLATFQLFLKNVKSKLLFNSQTFCFKFFISFMIYSKLPLRMLRIFCSCFLNSSWNIFNINNANLSSLIHVCSAPSLKLKKVLFSVPIKCSCISVPIKASFPTTT